MRIFLIALAIFVGLAGSGCERRDITDSTITAKVKSKMAVDAETSALGINVNTNAGVVTLTGAVPTQTGKTQAEQIARSTEGVTRVVNNISVEEGVKDAGVAAEDLTILSKIKARYISEGIMDANVDVKDGMVVLKGEVATTQDRARAESIARATSGVKNVNNRIVARQ